MVFCEKKKGKAVERGQRPHGSRKKNRGSSSGG